MSANIPEEFVVLKGQILDGMMDYLESGGDDEPDADYSEEDVDRCAIILEQFLEDVLSPAIYGQSRKIMRVVQGAVMALNELNAACDHSLIETNQREQICELIISAAANAGLRTDASDVTEEWREW